MVWLVVAVGALGCAGPEPQPEPDSRTGIASGAGHEEAVLITTSSVGCLELDATVTAVQRECRVVADTTIHLEGMPQRALRVDVGAGTVLAEIVDDRVWRITVRTPGPVTGDSVGVGTPVPHLADYPDVRVVSGEGRYFLMTPVHCGLSFGIEGVPFGEGPSTPAELRALPDRVRVERILVTGSC